MLKTRSSDMRSISGAFNGKAICTFSCSKRQIYVFSCQLKIPREEREALVKKIEADEITPNQAAKEYGVHRTTIYSMVKHSKEVRPKLKYY